MPDHWSDWHREISCEEFKSLPYKTSFVMDMHHIVPDPIPLQPGKTRHVCYYHTYFLSPSKFLIYIRVEGFEYTFCDRFCPEHFYEFTQTIKPGAMEIMDPAKRLSKFSVRVKLQSRLHVMKSLMLLEGQIRKENEK